MRSAIRLFALGICLVGAGPAFAQRERPRLIRCQELFAAITKVSLEGSEAPGDHALQTRLGSEPPGILLPTRNDLPRANTVALAKVNETNAVKYDPSTGRKFVATTRLYTCVAVVAYDKKNKVGMVSHLFVSLPQYEDPVEMKKYVTDLKGRFSQTGGDWNAADVTIVWGYMDRQRRLPRLQTLVGEIEAERTGDIRIESRVVARLNNVNATRSVFLDLENGEVTEATTQKNNYALSQYESATDTTQSR